MGEGKGKGSWKGERTVNKGGCERAPPCYIISVLPREPPFTSWTNKGVVSSKRQHNKGTGEVQVSQAKNGKGGRGERGLTICAFHHFH